MSPSSFSANSASSMPALNVLLRLLQPVEAFQLLGGGGDDGGGIALGARPHRLLQALHIADEALLVTACRPAGYRCARWRHPSVTKSSYTKFCHPSTSSSCSARLFRSSPAFFERAPGCTSGTSVHLRVAGHRNVGRIGGSVVGAVARAVGAAVAPQRACPPRATSARARATPGDSAVRQAASCCCSEGSPGLRFPDVPFIPNAERLASCWLAMSSRRWRSCSSALPSRKPSAAVESSTAGARSDARVATLPNALGGSPPRRW